jgi:hypothetical protein
MGKRSWASYVKLRTGDTRGLSPSQLEALRAVNTDTAAAFLAASDIRDPSVRALVTTRSAEIAQYFAAAFHPPLAADVSGGTAGTIGLLRRRIALGKDAADALIEQHFSTIDRETRDGLKDLYNAFANGMEQLFIDALKSAKKPPKGRSD